MILTPHEFSTQLGDHHDWVDELEDGILTSSFNQNPKDIYMWSQRWE